MKKNIKDLLDEEIIAQIESLKTLDDGSKEKQSAIDDLNTLYRLKIDETSDNRFRSNVISAISNRFGFDVGIRTIAIAIDVVFVGIHVDYK